MASAPEHRSAAREIAQQAVEILFFAQALSRSKPRPISAGELSDPPTPKICPTTQRIGEQQHQGRPLPACWALRSRASSMESARRRTTARSSPAASAQLPSRPRIRCPPLARQLFCIERSIQSALRMQRPRCAVPSPWPQRLTASVGEHSSSLPAPHVGRIESADAARPSLTTQVHHGDGRTGRVVWLPQRQQRRCLRLASPPSPPHFASLHASSPSPLPLWWRAHILPNHRRDTSL